MDLKKARKILYFIASIYWLLVLMIYFINFNKLKNEELEGIFWIIVLSIFAVASIYSIWGYLRGKKGKNNLVISFLTLCTKYSSLLGQLVNRDFKIKYKRSILGVAWSFINPLLMMLVQYIVFSTLFKSDTANYPVYLLSGTVLFTFFNEASGFGLTSITSNSNLIKKVYIPKYIYPLSKLISSLINLGISMFLLAIIMVITKCPFTINLFLLIFDLACFIIFTFGVILILSTLNTFFQDVAFLWSVISMVWMYLTPIFYTERIIPQKFLALYHANPLYQYINFARICIIDGQAPNMICYIYCLVPAVIMLVLGLTVFKWKQNKFVLYL